MQGQHKSLTPSVRVGRRVVVTLNEISFGYICFSTLSILGVMWDQCAEWLRVEITLGNIQGIRVSSNSKKRATGVSRKFQRRVSTFKLIELTADVF